MMQSVSADVGKSAKIGRNPPELFSFYIFFGGIFGGENFIMFCNLQILCGCFALYGYVYCKNPLFYILGDKHIKYIIV